MRNAKSESIPKMNSPATRHTTITTIVLFVVLFGVGHTTFLNSALQSLKYFKDCKAEFKKVVWPTPKSTTNNTIVVIVVCLVAGLFIFGIDSLFAFLNKVILG